MAQPGWYEDPHGGGGQRWWDGERWSEHTIPPPPAPSPPGVIPPPPTAAPPTGTAPVSLAGPTFVPAPGESAPAARSSTSVPPRIADPSRPPTASSGGGRSSKLLLVLLGLAFVVGIGAVVALLLTDDDADPVAEPPPAGAIGAGEERSFTVADEEEWELEVEVPAGQLVVDVRGEDGFDPVVTLLAADGRELARNDDRSSQQQDRYGGGTFDALLEQEIETAGSYRVVITGFAGQGGSGQVSFPVVGG